ncbi:MAG TPA: c-type cytochrome [Terriglobia bacterium]|nr:c-type cytochrome [Terriglobia bacterium]
MSFLKYMLLLFLTGAILTAAAAYMLARGFSARDEPTMTETFLARQIRHMSVPGAARRVTNPVAVTPAVLSEAMAHFADHCAFCHGNDGSGNTAIGKGFYPKPPDMRQADTQKLSDGELYYIIRNGVRFTGMPAFGADNAGSRDDDSWKLVQFIRHLPKMTDEELARMKDMNPKSPADLKEEDEIKRFLEGNADEPSGEAHKHH